MILASFCRERNLLATYRRVGVLVSGESWFYGDCTRTSLQRLRRSARRICWDVAANAAAKPRTRPIKTFRLCWNYRRATYKYEWRVQRFGVGLMPELYKHLNPMTPARALQAARKLAEDLRANGFGVSNGACTDSQLYKSSFAQARRPNRSPARIGILVPLSGDTLHEN